MFRKFCYAYDIPMVPVISWGLRFDLNDEGLRNYAEQTYGNGKPAEGIVIRPLVEQRINGDSYRLRSLTCNTRTNNPHHRQNRLQLKNDKVFFVKVCKDYKKILRKP